MKSFTISQEFYSLWLKWKMEVFQLAHRGRKYIVGQGQPMIIIWTNLVGPTTLMLHTKSQGHRPSGYWEEDFWRVFTIYGRGSHLGHVTRTIWTDFCSPTLRSLHMKYEFNWPSCFRGEDVWKCWRTPDAWVTGILLAHQWAFGSGELNTWYFKGVKNGCYGING